MDCQEHALVIGELIDGTADPEAARAARAHLQACTACQALADDLTRLRVAARTLEAPPLPAHLWPRIAAAFDAERRPRPRQVQSGLGTTGWAWLPAAAALLLVAGSLSWVGARLTPDAGPSVAAAAPDVLQIDDPEAVEDLRLAEAAFTDAIAGLEAAARAATPAPDAPAADEWLAGVAALDAAIDESREAVRAEPDSVLAQESLIDALRTKMVLLHDTMALMDDMRAGGPDGLAPNAGPERELHQ